MNRNYSLSLKVASLLIGLLLCPGGVVAGEGNTPKQSKTHSHMHGHTHGGKHDPVNMPGLRGKNASPEESAEIATLFRNFKKISRSVENLPNGIRAITNSEDKEVMAVLISHAVTMIERVKQKDDPQIIIQSPTLDLFFLLADEIESDVIITEEGLVVVQTSSNPKMVEALQAHAAEATAMADGGMDAMHEMMMKRGQSQ